MLASTVIFFKDTSCSTNAATQTHIYSRTNTTTNRAAIFEGIHPVRQSPRSLLGL